MGDFIYPGILSSVALLVYYFTLFKSGTARMKYKILAPSHDGPDDYVRRVRVHQNTLEHLALFQFDYFEDAPRSPRNLTANFQGGNTRSQCCRLGLLASI